MHRFAILLGITLATAIPAGADASITYDKVQEGDKELEIVRLTVTPAPEPVPALRHRLVARDVDLVTGNSVPFYYRAQLELSGTMKKIRERFNEEKELSLWYGTGEDATPVEKLPLD